jgi:hypothetical protein
MYRIAWTASGQETIDDVANVTSITPVGGIRQEHPQRAIVVTTNPILIEYGAKK